MKTILLILILLLAGCAVPKQPPRTKAEYMDMLAHTFRGPVEKWPEHLKHICICKKE